MVDLLDSFMIVIMEKNTKIIIKLTILSLSGNLDFQIKHAMKTKNNDKIISKIKTPPILVVNKKNILKLKYFILKIDY